MDYLVSIITASYNSKMQISETYHSINNQAYSNWEWLITDDCSTDDTYKELLAISEKDPRVKVFRNKSNSGAAVARNQSLSNAKGKFIAFIDSDDLWLTNKLATQVAFMGDDIDFSFTAYELIDERGERLNKFVDSTQTGTFSYKEMLRKKATMGCSTVMLRKEAYDDLTMPLLRTGQDYAFWLKLLKSGKNAHVLNDILTQYRILPNSISRNKFKKAKRQWQIYRELEKLNFFVSSINFCFYAYRAVFRKS